MSGALVLYTKKKKSQVRCKATFLAGSVGQACLSVHVHIVGFMFSLHAPCEKVGKLPKEIYGIVSEVSLFIGLIRYENIIEQSALILWYTHIKSNHHNI